MSARRSTQADRAVADVQLAGHLLVLDAADVPADDWHSSALGSARAFLQSLPAHKVRVPGEPDALGYAVDTWDVGGQEFSDPEVDRLLAGADVRVSRWDVRQAREATGEVLGEVRDVVIVDLAPGGVLAKGAFGTTYARLVAGLERRG